MSTFNHSNSTDLLIELRRRFSTATDVRAARIAQWLLGRNDTVLKALFSVSDAQLSILKTRLQGHVNAWQALRARTGE